MTSEEYAAEVAAALKELEDAQKALKSLEAKRKRLVTERKEVVTRLRARGVSGYRISKVMGVSQTTIGNISNK